MIAIKCTDIAFNRKGSQILTKLQIIINKENNFYLFIYFFSVTAPFYLEDSRRIQDSKRREWRSVWGGRKREREKERERARMQEREFERKCFGSSFYMFFPPPGPALCKLGLARSAVCSVCSA